MTATWRLAIAALLLAPLAATAGRRELRRLAAAELGLLLLAGVLLAAHFGLWTVSLSLTSVASSVVFVSLHPLLVAAGERWWLGTPLARGVLVGVACSLVGSALLGGHDLRLGGQALGGDLLALGGAVALAGYLLLGHRLRRRLGAIAWSFAVYTCAAVALAATTLAAGASLGAATPTDWLLFVALAVVSTLGGHTVFNWALRHLGASVVALAFVGEPAVAALLAWALLGEALAVTTALGGALILAGVYVAARAVSAPPESGRYTGRAPEP